MLDTVIRGGTVVDGSGQPSFVGDVGIQDGRIAAVGGKLGAAKREIDAQGAIVTPGWVDVHTHYDGQVTWDPYLSPSTHHGVTTAVMGNCGVGFAPVKPEPARMADQRDGGGGRHSRHGAQRRHPVGPGRAFRNTWTRWPPNRVRWTWAPRCRTAPCALT
jgi:N-acyl-D-aspartate/D-glutamate deacylase